MPLQLEVMPYAIATGSHACDGNTYKCNKTNQVTKMILQTNGLKTVCLSCRRKDNIVQREWCTAPAPITCSGSCSSCSCSDGVYPAGGSLPVCDAAVAFEGRRLFDLMVSSGPRWLSHYSQSFNFPCDCTPRFLFPRWVVVFVYYRLIWKYFL